MTATTNSLRAFVTLCDGECGYYDGFYEIRDASEESAKAVACDIAGDDLKRLLHCAGVRIGDVKYHFDRDELREAGDAR
jgi:hypothetical protein